MRGLLNHLTGELGDLLLVGSVVTAAPAWVGSIEVLSALGVDGGVAALLAGVYSLGRAGVSAAVLTRRVRSGGLDLPFSRLFEFSRSADAGLPTAADADTDVGDAVGVHEAADLADDS